MYKNTVIYPLVLAEVVNKTRPKEDEHEPVNIAKNFSFKKIPFRSYYQMQFRYKMYAIHGTHL